MLKGKVVLLVDDYNINRDLITKHLVDYGMIIVQAVNGKEGVQKKQSHQCDLILMDIRMPVMDGYKATQQIRSHDKTIPIIGLTAEIFEKELEKCYTSGMNDVIIKPVRKKSLIKKLIYWFKKNNNVSSSAIVLDNNRE
jgi:CheY-like chemotaxis protein